jgi:hypothetical protein
MRATIIVEADDAGQVAAGGAWFARWRPRLTDRSPDQSV